MDETKFRVTPYRRLLKNELIYIAIWIWYELQTQEPFC